MGRERKRKLQDKVERMTMLMGGREGERDRERERERERMTMIC